MQLSRHFDLYELIQSRKANELGISNYPSVGAQRALKHLCEHLLQPLRKALGKPIRINSGYRCERLNQAVGGVSTSQHLKGEAADCVIDGKAEKLLDLLLELELDFDQAILYKAQNFLHLSLKVDGGNRTQIIHHP